MKTLRWTLTFAVALGAAACCGGCIIGYKPTSDTVLSITRPEAGGRDVTTRLGFGYVYYDTLQNGYGMASWGLHPRDHEGYLYFAPYYSSPGTNESGQRLLLITPTGGRAWGGEGIYRLELYVPDYNLRPGMKEPGVYHLFTGTIGPPVKAGDGRLRVVLKDVEIVSQDSPPIRARLSGAIVADKDDPWEFEYRIKNWNRIVHLENENNAHP